MADFGVTADGFVAKGFDVILSEVMARAQDMFGDDVDLSVTSPLWKILSVTASEDALLWQGLEDVYYSRFISCAVGDDLDLLGNDVGVPRRFLAARGEVTITVGQPQPGRAYLLPEGTIVVTAGPSPIAFYTTVPASLTAEAPSATVPVQAFQPGPQGDVLAGAITAIDPVFQQLYLSLAPPTTMSAANQQPLSGGTDLEPDEDYRARLLGWPRTMWTLESMRAAVLEVPGVLDVQLYDPLGGVDVSQGYFGIFAFASTRSARSGASGIRTSSPWLLPMNWSGRGAPPVPSQGCSNWSLRR